jgi:hypothetical protein
LDVKVIEQKCTEFMALKKEKSKAVPLHALKAYVGMELELLSFVTSALAGGK